MLVCLAGQSLQPLLPYGFAWEPVASLGDLPVLRKSYVSYTCPLRRRSRGFLLCVPTPASRGMSSIPDVHAPISGSTVGFSRMTIRACLG